MYFVNEGAALLVSIFLGIYLIVVVISYNVNKPVLVNELINFATQYGTVQKKLLNEFEIPYALLDYNGKVLWVNEKFTEITGKTKNFHKSITSIFPGITRELIQQEQFVEDVNMVWQEHNFRIEMSKIYFEEMAENSSIVSIEEDEQYLTALYLFDETELYNYIRENEEQKLVEGLVYIDNYDEALDSIEDVKRSLLVALIDRKMHWCER